MKVSVYTRPEVPGVVSIRARAEGPGGLVGDAYTEVRSGQNFLGWTFDELAAMGNGNFDLQPKEGWTPPRPKDKGVQTPAPDQGFPVKKPGKGGK